MLAVENALEETCSGALQVSSMSSGADRSENGRRTSSSPANRRCGAGSARVRATHGARGEVSGMWDLS